MDVGDWARAGGVRRNTIGVMAAMALVMAAPGCDLFEPTKKCGEKRVHAANITAANPTGVQLFGNEARFTWVELFGGICADSSHADTEVTFHVFTNEGAAEPLAFKVAGEAYTSAFLQPKVANGSKANANEWRAAVNDIGFRQTTTDGNPAELILGLIVSFTSSGNLDADRIKASQYIREVGIIVTYRPPPEE
jgi:hypothetical protein